jgi:glycine cleavage system H protein
MHYTESHEWIDQEGKIGLTAHAKKELGEIVFLQLPEVGRQVKAGEEVAILESTKAATDFYAPVSGEVVAINKELAANPFLLNELPEEQGWLFQMHLSKPNELESFMDRESYLQLVSS